MFQPPGLFTDHCDETSLNASNLGKIHFCCYILTLFRVSFDHLVTSTPLGVNNSGKAHLKTKHSNVVTMSKIAVWEELTLTHFAYSGRDVVIALSVTVANELQVIRSILARHL